MHIWVDADACPVVIKHILFKAAKRTQTAMTLVANQPISIPPSPLINMLQVSSGFDAADNEIVHRLVAGDLVITGDIPLAAEVLEKGGLAINPRGEMYDHSSIKARLGMRDFMETMRASGVHTGGPTALGAQDKQRFANALDRLLTKQKK